MSNAPRHDETNAPAIEQPSAAVIESSTSLSEVWTRLGPTRWLGILWATSPALCGIALLTFLGPISDWLLVHPAGGLALYVVVFAITAGFGLLPTYAQSILGGWVFGFWIGWGAAMIGFTLASLIGYTVARTASHDRVEQLVETNAKARAIREDLIGHGLWRTLGIVTLIRVPPNSPFAITNLIMATTGVGILPYVVGTAIGMAPRTGVAVWLAAYGRGQGARDIQELMQQAKGPWYIIGGLVLTLIVFAIIGAIANHALQRVTGRSAALPSEPAEDPVTEKTNTRPRRPGI